MWFLVSIAFIIFIVIVIEFRFRKPDQIIIGESKGKVIRKKSAVYARHFSLPIPGVLFAQQLDIETEAKGKLALKIKAHLSVAADPENLTELVRAGGWKRDLIEQATKELIILIEQALKEHCEETEIEKLSSESLTLALKETIGSDVPSLGLTVVSVSILSVELVDENITQALRQRESARILEETEKENLQAQISTAQAENEAEEQIALLKHQQELKQIDLKQKSFEQEAVLDEKRTREEIKRRQLQLEFDQKEMALLKDNPELLILSPQMTRLAEASQSLKNARTIVSLSPNELEQGSQLLGIVQSFLQSMLQKSSASSKKARK